ncbi:hypothetical protein AAMO2058_001754600, partial [Amorphochlora amoebiformis]
FVCDSNSISSPDGMRKSRMQTNSPYLENSLCNITKMEPISQPISRDCSSTPFRTDSNAHLVIPRPSSGVGNEDYSIMKQISDFPSVSESPLESKSRMLGSRDQKNKRRIACMQTYGRLKEEELRRNKKHKGKTFCCCKVYSKKSQRVDTHYWSYRDITATFFSVIFVLGCWFILAVLSWNLRHKYSGWVTGTLIAFAQDIVMRFLQLIIIEILIFMPCCFIVTGCCLDPTKADQEYLAADNEHIKEIYFKTGKLGFEFFNLYVEYVSLETQAHTLGVKVGWKIVKIRNKIVTNDKAAFYELQDAHRTERKFKITFHEEMDVVEEEAFDSVEHVDTGKQFSDHRANLSHESTQMAYIHDIDIPKPKKRLDTRRRMGPRDFTRSSFHSDTLELVQMDQKGGQMRHI